MTEMSSNSDLPVTPWNVSVSFQSGFRSCVLCFVSRVWRSEGMVILRYGSQSSSLLIVDVVSFSASISSVGIGATFPAILAPFTSTNVTVPNLHQQQCPAAVPSAPRAARPQLTYDTGALQEPAGRCAHTSLFQQPTTPSSPTPPYHSVPPRARSRHPAAPPNVQEQCTVCCAGSEPQGARAGTAQEGQGHGAVVLYRFA